MAKAIRADRRHERSWTEWNVPWELGEIRGGNWAIKTMDQFHLEITRCTRNSSHGKPHSVGSKRELWKDGKGSRFSID